MEDKIKKNYYRVNLLNLLEDSKSKPVIISGKYYHRKNKYYITFGTIRPYIEGRRTYTLCEHINILKKDINKYCRFLEEDNHKKFYLIVYPIKYLYKGEERGAFKLCQDLNICPIIPATEKYRITNSLLEKVYNSYDDKYIK